MKNIKSIKSRLNLTVSLVLFVFGVFMASFILVAGMTFALHSLGLLENIGMQRGNPIFPIFVLLFICVLLGTAIAGFMSKRALNPMRQVITATHEVSQGNFNVKVNLKGVGELEELSQSFNKMTQELSSIETLRSDFVNNFSHEFKTPIVSIRGFAKLLQDGNLSEEEKQDYLKIIITESERLSELATNVLNLSKYENIEIITDKAPFRIDEQIRRAILLTEPKWSEKEINISIEMEEIIYDGNEDLTQQIWLNLIDNAVKFTGKNGNIDVRLSKWNDSVRFIISDSGAGISEQMRLHIFDKFYQGDASHTKAGNGLGLTIVKRIVDLCGGTIGVESEQGKGSSFIVYLPIIY